MKEEKEIPKAYYEKILVSSGEVPEKEGWQDTNRGPVQWVNGIWQLSRNNIIPVTYFYKQASVPSPKQEALDFVRRILKEGYAPAAYPDGDLWSKIDNPEEEFKTEQLYDKFKEKGESK